MMQKKLQMKNAEDTAGEIHHTLEIQNLEQALKELRLQLAERNSQIDSYEKVQTLQTLHNFIRSLILLRITRSVPISVPQILSCTLFGSSWFN